MTMTHPTPPPAPPDLEDMEQRALARNESAWDVMRLVARVRALEAENAALRVVAEDARQWLLSEYSLNDPRPLAARLTAALRRKN